MLPSDIEQQGFLPSDDPSKKQQEIKTENNQTIVIVRWEDYKLPIPLNHAVFMRKVFFTLICQLLVTAGIIACCIYIDEVREWIIMNYWIYWVGIVGFICIFCALMQTIDNYPVNVFLLCVFTVFMGMMIGTLCAAYASVLGGDLVMQAFGITILVFLALALFACQTRCNLMPLGLVAFMICNVLFWWAMWAIIFGWYDTGLISLLFIIVFCLYILVDVWRICNTNVFDESAWIAAAINLYLDIINLFLWILRLMARSQ